MKLTPKSVGIRFLATLLDMIVLWIVLMAVMGTTFISIEGAQFFSGMMWAWYLVVILYYVLMEAYLGGTLGKLIVGIRIVKEDGKKITIVDSLIRTVLRVIDGLFCYLVAAILVWSSEKRQRLGDKAAHTIVVSAKELSGNAKQ